MPNTGGNSHPQTLSLCHRRKVVAAHQRARQLLEHERLQLASFGPRARSGARRRWFRRRSGRARAACRSPGRTADTCVRSSSSSSSARTMHSATSPTYTGWKRVRAPASGITGAKRMSLANRLRKRSSRPKITDGSTIVQSKTRRDNGRLGLALAAQVLARPRQGRRAARSCARGGGRPMRSHAATTFLASSTWARANVFVPDSLRMPTRLMTVDARWASRRRSGARWTSASTTSTVGSTWSRWRLSRRRVGTMTRRAVIDESIDDVPADETAAADDENRATCAYGRRHVSCPWPPAARRRRCPRRGATVPSRVVSGT